MDTKDTKSIEIYLWLLERTETADPGQMAKCLVAASTEHQARQIANEDANGMDPSVAGYVWTDGALVASRRLGVADDEIQGVIFWAPEI